MEAFFCGTSRHRALLVLLLSLRVQPLQDAATTNEGKPQKDDPNSKGKGSKGKRRDSKNKDQSKGKKSNVLKKTIKGKGESGTRARKSPGTEGRDSKSTATAMKAKPSDAGPLRKLFDKSE